MKTLFNENTIGVNRKNTRFEGAYITENGLKVSEQTLSEVRKAEILTSEEVLAQGFDCVNGFEYLQITLIDGETLTWDNSMCSLRQAR